MVADYKDKCKNRVKEKNTHTVFDFVIPYLYFSVLFKITPIFETPTEHLKIIFIIDSFSYQRRKTITPQLAYIKTLHYSLITKRLPREMNCITQTGFQQITEDSNYLPITIN